MTTLEQIVSLCKRRGFAYPSCEIYGGWANGYTYGPYGAQLKKNIKDLWWNTFVAGRADVHGIDGDIILHPKVWEASGHTATFNDLLIDNKITKKRYRADHLIEAQHQVDVEGWTTERVNAFIIEKGLKDPTGADTDWTEARTFNLMFQTQMAKTGDASTAYLRPETAQVMFLEYKNITQSMRVKLPFGIAQTGRAFRNEITPGNFLFRRLEFEQMEIEYFVRETEWEEHFEHWYGQMNQWCDTIGLPKTSCHWAEHAGEKLSHYSKRTADIEFDFPFGRKELYGLSYRSDYDLKAHAEASGKSLHLHDEQTGTKMIPHVIEPTWGVDRTVLAVLCSAYSEETLEDNSTRTVLRIAPIIAPVKVAVLPLMKKDGMAEKAQSVADTLRPLGVVEYDQSGNIGKRYRRQDEIGTPACVTIDYDTMSDDTVTLRDRDTMAQKRVAIGDLLQVLRSEYGL